MPFPKVESIDVNELMAIIEAERRYWLASESEGSIGAVGALSNIICAAYGERAPWHPMPQAAEPVTSDTSMPEGVRTRL